LSLQERVQKDLTDAMKAKDGTRVSVLRLLLAALKNRRIELMRDLAPEQELEIAQREVKRRNESIEMFRQGGRADLVAREEAELAILRGYLPQQLSAEELAALVREAVAETGAASPAQTGMVMKLLMPRIKGRADGKMAKEMVEKLLVP
jgi:uncharacterized protein YqeY